MGRIIKVYSNNQNVPFRWNIVFSFGWKRYIEYKCRLLSIRAGKSLWTIDLWRIK